MLLMVGCAVVWASVAQVDIIAKAEARVVPDGKDQLIASLEGGILRELMVREGQQVAKGADLATLDPTRVEAQQAEGQTKRLSLRGAVVRLQAEATGKPLRFPTELAGARAVVEGETESYQARQTALNEAVVINRRSIGLLQSELAMAEGMSAKGLMSEVEVMRVRRQVNELSLQTQERINRFRQEASAELVRVRTELSMLEEQMVVRDDVLRRTVLKSPVDGIVKSTKNHTVGGVIAPGAPLMEIVPWASRRASKRACGLRTSASSRSGRRSRSSSRPTSSRCMANSTPRCTATEKMSLSPRPHRLARMIWSLPIVGAIFWTAAIAWLGSSAGMMPSVRQSSWNASSASVSVTEV